MKKQIPNRMRIPPRIVVRAFVLTMITAISLCSFGTVRSTTRPHQPPPAPTLQQNTSEFAFAGFPTVSLTTYQAVYCLPRHGVVSDACPYAPQMYQMLVDAGIDPVIEMAFAAKETEFGTTGPGRRPQYNIHNIVCNSWDGGSCEGPHHWRFSTYRDYLHATRAWIDLMTRRGRYIDAGRNSFSDVIPIYAPAFENDTSLYIAQAERWVRGWRSWDGAQQLPITPPIWGAGIRLPGIPIAQTTAAAAQPLKESAPVLSDQQPPPPPPAQFDPVPELPTPTMVPIVAEPPARTDIPQPPPGAIVVDNNDSGFSSNQNTWQTTACGLNGDHLVIASTSDIYQSTSRASWLPTLLEAGTYEVQAYIPPCGSIDATHSARYIITHDGGITVVTVDQQAHKGTWVSLGRYSFSARLNPTIEISDQTSDNNLSVRADAIAWIPEKTGTVPIASIFYLTQLERDNRTPWSEDAEGLAEYGGVPMPDALPTRQPVEDTPMPTPADDILTIGVVRNGTTLRHAPEATLENALATVCPGDQVTVFAREQKDGRIWLRVRITATDNDCATDRAPIDSEGWISGSLIEE